MNFDHVEYCIIWTWLNTIFAQVIQEISMNYREGFTNFYRGTLQYIGVKILFEFLKNWIFIGIHKGLLKALISMVRFKVYFYEIYFDEKNHMNSLKWTNTRVSTNYVATKI